MDKHYDILVAGAGSAGFTAAVMVGRLGKRVLLVEKNGMPGGMMHTTDEYGVISMIPQQIELAAKLILSVCE